MTEDVKNCIEQAERFLVLREHNRNELVDKLKNKGYSSETIDETVKFLIDTDELNEERYIRAFVRSSNKKHPEGKFTVLLRLSAKKADRELSKSLVEEIYTDEYTNSLLENAYKKIEKKGKITEKFQVRQELIKLGFSSSEINTFFDTYK